MKLEKMSFDDIKSEKSEKNIPATQKATLRCSDTAIISMSESEYFRSRQSAVVGWSSFIGEGS